MTKNKGEAKSKHQTYIENNKIYVTFYGKMQLHEQESCKVDKSFVEKKWNSHSQKDSYLWDFNPKDWTLSAKKAWVDKVEDYIDSLQLIFKKFIQPLELWCDYASMPFSCSYKNGCWNTSGALRFCNEIILTHLFTDGVESWEYEIEAL